MGPRGNAAPDSRTGTPATSSSPATSSPLATLAGRLYPLTYTPPTVPQPRCPVRNAGTWYQIASCCWDSMSVGPVIYGALCPPILQSTGPCAPQSCNLQGRLPPVSTILELSYPSTPPYSSPRGLRAPPMPPLFIIAGRHSHTYPVSKGVIPPPIQCCRAFATHPSSVVRHPPPTHSVLQGMRAPSYQVSIPLVQQPGRTK